MLKSEVKVGGMQESLMASSGRNMATAVWVQLSSGGGGFRPSCLQGFTLLKCTLAKLWFYVSCPSSSQLTWTFPFTVFYSAINKNTLLTAVWQTYQVKQEKNVSIFVKNNSRMGFSAVSKRYFNDLFVFHLFFHFQAVYVIYFVFNTCLNHQELLLAAKSNG